MKFIPKSAFVYLRGAIALTLLSGALALAFVATTAPTKPTTVAKVSLDKPSSHTDIRIAREDFQKPVPMDLDEAGPAPRFDDPTAAMRSESTRLNSSHERIS